MKQEIFVYNNITILLCWIISTVLQIFVFNSIVYPAMPITSRLRLPAPTVFNIVFRFYPSYVKSQNMTYKNAITLQIKFSHTGTLANFFKSENDFL